MKTLPQRVVIPTSSLRRSGRESFKRSTGNGSVSHSGEPTNSRLKAVHGQNVKVGIRRRKETLAPAAEKTKTDYAVNPPPQESCETPRFCYLLFTPDSRATNKLTLVLAMSLTRLPVADNPASMKRTSNEAATSCPRSVLSSSTVDPRAKSRTMVGCAEV